MTAIGSVLLAAGRGTRFGTEPKLLAELDGCPLVRHAAEAALAARPRPVVAVTGAHGAAVRAALIGLDLVLVENADFQSGLATSLRAGLAALPPSCEVAVVLLADMPRIRPAQIDDLVAAFERVRPEPAAVVPVWEGRRGNPVLLNLRLLREAIAGLRGDRGAGLLLQGRSDVIEIAGAASTAQDVDTGAALEAIRSSPQRARP